MRSNSLLFFAAICLVAFWPHPAEADVVVYSTIDPNTTTFTFTSSGISTPVYNNPPGASGYYGGYVDQFSPTTTFVLSSIAFGVRTVPGASGSLTAVIYANNPTTNLPLPMAPLAASSAVAPPEISGPPPETVSLTTFDFSDSLFAFVSGQTYWVGLEPGGQGTDVDWGFSSNNATGRVARNTGNGYQAFTFGGTVEMQKFGAFRISAAVPEPATTSLLGFAAVASVATWLRKRSKA